MIEDYYTDLTYKAPTVSKGDDGMQSKSWGTAVSFRGYIWQLSASEQTVNAKNSVVSTHGLMCDYNAALKKNYAVFDASGNEYKVLTIAQNPGGQNHHKRVNLELVS